MKHNNEDDKNSLQRIFQIKKVALPIYHTRKTGHDHMATYVSTVKLYDGTVITGHSSRTIKQAEKSAASVALKQFTTMINNDKSNQHLSSNNKPYFTNGNYDDELDDEILSTDFVLKKKGKQAVII